MTKILKPLLAQKLSTSLKLLLLAINAISISWLVEFVFLGKPYFLAPAALLIFFLSSYSKIRIGANIIGIISALLYPLSRTLDDGLLQWASIEVLLTTNFDEALGFHESLPTKLIYQGGLCGLICITFIIFNKRLNLKYSRLTKRCFFLCALAVLPWLSISGYKAIQPKITDMIDAYNQLSDTPKLLEPQWEITSLTGKQYRKYVIVVGESMRADMHSSYGFHFDTSPIIDKTPKKLISNFIAPAAYTLLSVPRLLSIVHDDGSFESQHNAVTLAKSAGLQTYWISAQGYAGHFNIGSSILANYADQQYFSYMGLDEVLLPKIREIISKDEAQAIFVHIKGSHENPCRRLGNHPNLYKTKDGSQILSCYLTTYNYTDDFIATIISMLKETVGKDYALMYFSDHGLNFVKDGEGYSLKRDPKVKQGYQIPFFITSGYMTETTVYDVLRSGNNLMHYFPTWFGVSTNRTQENYDIFNAPNDNPMVMDYDEVFHPYTNLHEGVKADEMAEFVSNLN